MRVRLQGGPGDRRVYDLPKPLAGELSITSEDRTRRAVYTLHWAPPPRPGREHDPVYRYERTEDIGRPV